MLLITIANTTDKPTTVVALPAAHSSCSSSMRRRWRLSFFLASFSMATVRAKNAPSGVEPLDLLSGFAGTYTHFVDDELSVTVSYDLQDDTHAPLSYITG